MDKEKAPWPGLVLLLCADKLGLMPTQLPIGHYGYDGSGVCALKHLPNPPLLCPMTCPLPVLHVDCITLMSLSPAEITSSGLSGTFAPMNRCPPRMNRRFWASDHPRVCGEHRDYVLRDHPWNGSSPRVRGTRLASGAQFEEKRIIPACAGNTDSCGSRRSRGADHPRVCGEHFGPTSQWGFKRGSSPRVRGTPLIVHLGGELSRIIPACAGNTWDGRIALPADSDHPRVCGEHRNWGCTSMRAPGSSPRVQGTRTGCTLRLDATRIIPACAGNTYTALSRAVTITDHPRVCGEHRYPRKQSHGVRGSSPRVRGTQIERRGAPNETRIIPACAGNTRNRHGDGLQRPDHPRVCGEHRMQQAGIKGVIGSSPRVRGTRVDDLPDCLPRRIIPACAGNTLGSRRAKHGQADHPRVCGEHPSIATHAAASGGSSPRVRGTPSPAGWTSNGWLDHPRVCGEHARAMVTSGPASGSSPRVRGTRCIASENRV